MSSFHPRLLNIVHSNNLLPLYQSRWRNILLFIIHSLFNAVIEIIATITAATGVIATPAIIAIKLIHEVINKKPKKEPNSFSHLHC